MKVKVEKSVSGSMFAKMFGSGRKKLIGYDEEKKELLLASLEGKRAKSKVSLKTAAFHNRFVEIFYGDSGARGVAIDHGLRNENPAIEKIIAEQYSGAQWTTKQQFEMRPGFAKGDAVSAFNGVGYIDLAASENGKLRHIHEVKCPHARDKALMAFRNLALMPDKAEAIIATDPAWYGQLQFYMALLGENVAGFLTVYDPRIIGGMITVELEYDKDVAKLVEDIIPHVNEELKNAAADFAKLGIERLDEAEQNNEHERIEEYANE